MGFILLVISHYMKKKKVSLISPTIANKFIDIWKYNIMKIYSYIIFPFLCVLQEDLQDKWNWICSIHECWPEGTGCVSCSILVSTSCMSAICTSAAVSLTSTGIFVPYNNCTLLRFTLTFKILGSVRIYLFYFLKEMNTFILQRDIKLIKSDSKDTFCSPKYPGKKIYHGFHKK